MAMNVTRNQDATIYVGNLDERVTEGLLWELMLQAGPVATIYIPKDRVTQQHQGYGFCEFLTPDDAEYAVRIMNAVQLYAKPLKINKAAADKQMDIGAQIFIGNLTPEVDETLIYDTFKVFGTIIGAPQVSKDVSSGESKGFAFLGYDDFDASDAAIGAMNGQWLANSQITVSYAFKKDGKGERHGSDAERLLAAQGKKMRLTKMAQHGIIPAHAAGIQTFPSVGPGGFFQAPSFPSY